MTHLIIGLDCVKGITPAFCANPEDYGQCKLTADIQDSLLDTGLATQLFSTALLNLRSLKNVDVRDFNSYTRHRDATSHQSGTRSGVGISAWKSYGHSRLKPWSRYLDEASKTHGLCGRPVHAHSFVDRVFKALVTALGQSGGHVRGLEVLLRHRHMGLSDGAFAAGPLIDMIDIKLPLVLSGLNKLHLDLDVTRQNIPLIYYHHSSSIFDMPESVQEVHDPATANLRRFLGLTANLTWLRLNDVGSNDPQATRLLFWLALDPEKPFGSADEAGWSDINPKPVSLPLRRLDLGRMTVDSNTLGLVVQKFDKLESLSLREINLYEPNYLQQGINARDDNHDASTWTRFFQKLPTIAPNLKHLLLKEISQEKMRGTKELIVFEPPVTDTHVKYRINEELYFTDKASLDTLANRTWTAGAWNAVRDSKSSSDSHGPSHGNEYDEPSDSDSLAEVDEDSSDDNSN